MKTFLWALLCMLFISNIIKSQQTTEPYSIELERIFMPGSPSIHSFAFAESNGKWLFIGGRTNGLHGFSAGDAFPKQYANKNIFVVNPNTSQTWSRNIFSDISYTIADPFRSTNMQHFQDGNKLYIIGGYGFDSISGGFVTFSTLTVIDVEQVIQAVSTGASVSNYIRQITDSRMQVCGGELQKLGEYFYLVGGHKFTGYYHPFDNEQVYSDQIKKFKILDDGINLSVANYSASTDTIEFHRRDMNVVPAIKPDGISHYAILYGGVFRHGVDLPFLNPVYIDAAGNVVDYSFDQKMSQYTCSYLSAFNVNDGSMHTTFFGGMSVYYYNEITQMQVYDSLVPFIDDITTLTKNASGVSDELISVTKMPTFLGTNARFIFNEAVPHFNNKVIKLNELTGRTFAGYIYGGIRALLPNNTPSFPSDYILKVYITPKSININPIGNTIPAEFALDQNFPNPFNPVTKIKFNLPSSSEIKLNVYDGLGRLVTNLVDSRLNAGVYEVDWDANNFTSGIYFYRIDINNPSSGIFSQTKKMLLIK
ncbi:MAG: T9SS type A sorting domain-containing protein [Bacteroidota bacterium]|nr:T9SS type A sorting domain-containing protein [Bacteroidota bacterium]